MQYLKPQACHVYIALGVFKIHIFFFAKKSIIFLLLQYYILHMLFMRIFMCISKNMASVQNKSFELQILRDFQKNINLIVFQPVTKISHIFSGTIIILYSRKTTQEIKTHCFYHVSLHPFKNKN